MTVSHARQSGSGRLAGCVLMWPCPTPAALLMPSPAAGSLLHHDIQMVNISHAGFMLVHMACVCPCLMISLMTLTR